MDDLEDLDELPTTTNYILHPPGDGDVSECESGDDENRDLNRLPRSMLVTSVEIIDETGVEEIDDERPPPTKKAKKTPLTWIEHGIQMTSEFDVIQETSELSLENDEPITFFRLLWDNQVNNFILNQTEAYSGEPIQPNELDAVLGVLAASGVVSQTRRRDYWSSNDLKRNVAISRSIGIHRFEKIFSKLHFLPKESQGSKDKFQKVRLLITMLNRRFMAHVPSTNSFSVDESIIPYYGRHGCKQFIRGKPLRFGFKCWVLATSQGYCCHVEPYPGLAEAKSDEYDLGSSSNVVFYLARKLREHHNNDQELSITTDNCFTSLPLLTKLKNDLNIIATGTIRINRIPSFPVHEVDFKERGEMKCFRENINGELVTAWKDNKTVYIASSCIGSTPITTTKRYCRKEKKKIEIPIPACVALYNRTMGGVDSMDQRVSHCRSSIRGKKWYFPIAINLFDITIVNAWHLHRLNSSETKRMDLNTFRTSVAESLLQHNNKKQTKASVSRSIRFDELNHIVQYTSQKNRCRLCQKTANFTCRKCNVHLHAKVCFEDYHMK